MLTRFVISTDTRQDQPPFEYLPLPITGDEHCVLPTLGKVERHMLMHARAGVSRVCWSSFSCRFYLPAQEDAVGSCCASCMLRLGYVMVLPFGRREGQHCRPFFHENYTLPANLCMSLRLACHRGRCNYIPTFQCLKKSRSHASIAQSPDDVVGHMQHVASAPINYRNSCSQDTEVPACCGQVSGAALPGDFEYAGRPLVMRLRPSASSSTALSCGSGASSPALRDPGATDASIATARAAGARSGFFEHQVPRLSHALSTGADCGLYDSSCCSSGTGMGPAAPATSCQPSGGAPAPALVAASGQNTPHGPGTDSLFVRGPPGPLPQGTCQSPTHAQRSPLATLHAAATTPPYSPMQGQDDFLPDTLQSPQLPGHQQQGPVYDTTPAQSNGSAVPQPMVTDTSGDSQLQLISPGIGLRPCAGHTSVPGIPCTSCHGSPTAGYRVTGGDLATGLPGQAALGGLVATMASQPSAGGAGARGSAASREDASSDSIRELWSAVQSVSRSLRAPAADDQDAEEPLAGQIPLPGFALVDSSAGPWQQQLSQGQGAAANEPPIALPSIRTRISAPVVPASPSGSAANSPARVGATAAAVFAARRSGLARTTSLLPEASAQHSAHVQFQHHYPQHDHHHHHDGPTSTLASPLSRPPPPYMSNGHDAFTHRQHNHRSPNAAAAYDSQPAAYQHHQHHQHHSHQHQHDEFAPYPRPHHQQTLPAALLGLSYTTYGYRRARSTALESCGMSHGLGSSGHLATSDESSEEDDQEEATRRITQAFRTHTGMAGSSGRGLLGADTAPSTPTGICGEPGNRGTRDTWGPKASDNGTGSVSTCIGVSGI